MSRSTFATCVVLVLSAGRALGSNYDVGPNKFPTQKDLRTGFVEGGKNPTTLIRNLTQLNGHSIADLEEKMRPGRYSVAGFLGTAESLIDVLVADNEFVVDKMGLTHQELARHLQIIGSVAIGRANRGPTEFTYHGRRFQVEAVGWWGDQESPFDDGAHSSHDVKLIDPDTKQTLEFSMLLPQMIHCYGFYEGRGTRYRVEPNLVVDMLGHAFHRSRRGTGAFLEESGTWILTLALVTSGVAFSVWLIKRTPKPMKQREPA